MTRTTRSSQTAMTTHTTMSTASPPLSQRTCCRWTSAATSGRHRQTSLGVGIGFGDKIQNFGKRELWVKVSEGVRPGFCQAGVNSCRKGVILTPGEEGDQGGWHRGARLAAAEETSFEEMLEGERTNTKSGEVAEDMGRNSGDVGNSVEHEQDGVGEACCVAHPVPQLVQALCCWTERDADVNKDRLRGMVSAMAPECRRRLRSGVTESWRSSRSPQRWTGAVKGPTLESSAPVDHDSNGTARRRTGWRGWSAQADLECNTKRKDYKTWAGQDPRHVGKWKFRVQSRGAVARELARASSPHLLRMK